MLRFLALGALLNWWPTTSRGLARALEARWAYLVSWILEVAAYALAFGEFLRQLNFVFGGFDVVGAGFWDWAWYGFSWVVETSLLTRHRPLAGNSLPYMRRLAGRRGWSLPSISPLP